MCQRQAAASLREWRLGRTLLGIFPPNKRVMDSWANRPTSERQPGTASRAGGLIASSRLIALVGGSGRHEPPFASVSHIRVWPLLRLCHLSWPCHAHTRVELVVECHSVKPGTRIWLQQGSPDFRNSPIQSTSRDKFRCLSVFVKIYTSPVF